jgi:hypothetical protein
LPLGEAYDHARYDPAQLRAYFAAATQAALALAAFRTPYSGPDLAQLVRNTFAVDFAEARARSAGQGGEHDGQVGLDGVAQVVAERLCRRSGDADA